VGTLLAIALVALVTLIGLCAVPLARRAVGGVAGPPPSLPLAWVVVFSALFLGGYHLLGFAALARGGGGFPAWAPPAAGLLVGLAVLGLARALGTPAPVPRVERPAPGRIKGPAGIALGACALTYAAAAVMLVFGFPRGFEVSAYHLPIAVHFMQTGSLSVWDTVSMHTFPANMSVIEAFLLPWLPEHLLSALDIPFLALAAWAVFHIARRTGADAPAALLAAVGLMTIPIFAFSSFELGADVAGAAFLALAACFTLAAPTGRWPLALLAGLAGGLACGFKPLHLIGVAALAAVLAVATWRAGGAGAAARRVPVFLAGAALTFGYWLARNGAQFGNPLYPIHFAPWFDLLGWPAAPDIAFADRGATQLEWVRSSAGWLVYPWVEWQYIGENFKHSSGLGAFFATTVPVATIVAALRTAVPRLFGAGSPGPRAAWAVPALLGTGAAILAVWWLVGDRQPRYFMGAVVVLTPLSAWAIALVRGPRRRAYEWLVAGAILCMLAVIATKELVTFGQAIVHGGETERFRYYDYPPEVDRLPPGSTILNLDRRTSNFALAGAGHGNRVISYLASCRAISPDGATYVPINSVQCGEAASGWRITAPVVRELGVTHVYVVGTPRFGTDGCAALTEVARQDRNPLNGEVLAEPRLLFAVSVCGADGP
jgi:hypothetical protein